MTCITIHIFYLIESEEVHVVSDDSDSDEMHKVSDASAIDQGYLKLKLYCVIMRGHIKGAASVTNQLYHCGFICKPAYLRMRKFSLIRPLNITQNS